MSEHEDAITSKNDHKQIVIDQAAVDLSIDKNLAQNTDTELGTDADLSVGETRTVLNEDGTAIHVLAWRCVNSKADIRRRVHSRRIQGPIEKDRSLAAASHQTDKTATGIQAIFGLRTDLSLHGEQYNWLTTIQDDLGITRGFVTFDTRNFQALLAKESQVLVSLKTVADGFDFLPYDRLANRISNGQYHWAELQPTLPSGPLNITREWFDIDGDVSLNFSLENVAETSIELGSLGFPTEFNNIFTGRDAAEMAAACSLADPYIGMHAGHIRVALTKGTGSALMVTPLGDAPLEAYRNLVEPNIGGTDYGSQTFEGLYEWQVLSKARAEMEWAGVEPWNIPTSRILAPGETLTFGIRFSVATDGVRSIDQTIRSIGFPVARSVPGYVIPRDSEARLLLQANPDVSSASAQPEGSLSFELSRGAYTVTPSTSAWGRVRTTVVYADGTIQTIYFFVTKSGTEAVQDLGHHSTTAQWYTDMSDIFDRAPSVMTYDYEEKATVLQEPRVWVAGLSDDAGAGAYLAAMVKQFIQPDAEEIHKLESFVGNVLWKTIQSEDYGVRRSIFF
ncbi:hypothetical protein LQW54_003829 [Pestalotiopsis sp. IQ-011]